jgi:hypothetical protein
MLTFRSIAFLCSRRLAKHVPKPLAFLSPANICIIKFAWPKAIRQQFLDHVLAQLHTSMSTMESQIKLEWTDAGYSVAMKIKVEYQAGVKGEPVPAVVWFGSRRLAVNGILDRWYGTNRRWWKLDTEGGVYILRCEEGSEEWELAAVPRT